MLSKLLKVFWFILLISSCKESSDDLNLQKYLVDDKLIVEKVLENVPIEDNQFLLITEDLCSKCFRQIISHFEQKDGRGQIILMGANDYEIKRFNAIYDKSLKFWKGNFEMYEILRSKYKNQLTGYVRYVEINSDTLIYEGKGGDITAKTKDVLNFHIKREQKNE